MPRKKLPSFILDEAKVLVHGDRQASYGHPWESFKLIARLWSEYVGTHIRPSDVPLMMILLKIARSRTGYPSRDTFIDGAGYFETAEMTRQATAATVMRSLFDAVHPKRKKERK